MDRWLATLPSKIIAFGAISIGIILIVLFDPPHSLCDSQKEIFIKEQTGFLFIDKKTKGITTTVFTRLIDACKDSNSPGGCYELFGKLRGLRKDLRAISLECSATIAKISQVKNTILESTELMAQLAWGPTGPPAKLELKFGWLDPTDMNLFCELKEIIRDFYGNPQWEDFREKIMTNLPGAKDIDRKEVWEKSILSAKCAQF